MAMTAGEIVWRITGDKSGFDKSIKSTEKSAKSLGNTMKQVGKTIGVALAAAGLTRFMKDMVKAGSDAEETAQKFGVVFKGVSKEANKMAKELADSFGFSIQESKKLLSNTGDLLTGFGLTSKEALNLSNDVQMLAADLASFSNVEGGAAFASEALTKGLFGETEQMKSLGIVINQNSEEFKTQVKRYQEVEGKTLLQAKAMTILSMATEQSKNSIGDFARSQDSWANVQRRITARLQDMSANIGQDLLPGLRNLGIAFLAISKDGSIFADALSAIFKNISVVLSGISLMVLKFQEWRNETKIDDTLAQQKELNKQLKDNISVLESYGYTQNQINEISKKGQLPETLKGYTDEAEKLGELIRLQNKRKAVFDEGQSAFSNQKQVENALLKIRENLAEGTKDTIAEREKEIQQSQRAVEQNKKESKSIKEKKTALQSLTESIQKNAQSYSTGISQIQDLFSAIDSLNTAIGERRLSNLDAEMEQELLAHGLIEETKEQALENDIRRAEMKGDVNTATEKKEQLERLKIENKYAKKRAMIEYQVALQSWKFKLAFAIASVPLAIMQGLIAGLQIPIAGIVLGPVYAALAGAMAGIQVAAVAASKPKPPSFQMGGIVPGNSPAGDNIAAQVNSGELILNGAQQRRLFDIADGRSQPGGMGNISIYIGDELLYDNLYEATKNGDLLIDTRAVTDV